ncbi:unnamed protein product [Periconia digitata]|uniref:Uncharacterized protein n=1 Tax=Periconia digitata TaxID=1303443 RepID=A0A9W4UFT6_9PLEO|nr:unnamed protein product [Periconia digitata]
MYGILREMETPFSPTIDSYRNCTWITRMLCCTIISQLYQAWTVQAPNNGVYVSEH